MPRILQTEFWVVCSYIADMAVFKTWLKVHIIELENV